MRKHFFPETGYGEIVHDTILRICDHISYPNSHAKDETKPTQRQPGYYGMP
jgi:hypothetical protein